MNRLKELRKAKGLTQEELANEMGVTKLTISRWENEERQIKSDKAKQLADYFGVDLGYLYGYQPINVIQELISENELLRDENRRLTKDLNNTITELEAFIYGRKDKKTVN